MEKLILKFFPYPYALDGQRYQGFRIRWPELCDRCDRQCERQYSNNLQLCSYGGNFIWLTKTLLLFGVLVSSAKNTSAAHAKAIRNYRHNVVREEDIETVRKQLDAIFAEHAEDVELKKKAIIDEYVRTKEYEKDYLVRLGPEIQKSFSFVHDYRQFISRVRQHINVLLERHPGEDLEKKLSRAFPAEKAIYWSTVLMEEKLKTAFFLTHPEKIADAKDRTIFRLHGLVTKYLRIYEQSFSEKEVKQTVRGFSVGEIEGNSMAVGVIPHTLIDNALKYSVRGSEVIIEFIEKDESIELTVNSYGPLIAPDEREKIFEIFYRGRDATRQEEEGAGFGLYLAQFIAVNMGTKIYVDQKPTKVNKFGYPTTFSIRFFRKR